jgi:hypothetical protein
MMRWTVLGAAALLAAATPAWAQPGRTITGTPKDDVLVGTPGADTIRGLAGNDDITGGRGDDRVFGGEGNDVFHWANGDGHDLIRGGPGDTDTGNSLQIAAGRSLRLHIQALDTAPPGPPPAGTQVIGVADLHLIDVEAAPGSARMVVSTDPGVATRGLEFGVNPTAAGQTAYIDLTGVQVPVSGGAGDTAGAVSIIKGSAKFFNDLGGGKGDERVWTGAGGSYLGLGTGQNEMHLGPGVDQVVEFHEDDPFTHDTVFGFAKGDYITLFDADSSKLDTNGDGWVDAKDRHVTVTNGSMTVHLTPVLYHFNAPILLTIVGRTRLPLARFDFECGC